jgi:hypothetical protein
VNAAEIVAWLTRALQAFVEDDQSFAVRVVDRLRCELEEQPALVARLGRALEALDEGDQLLAVGIVDDLRRELEHEPGPYTFQLETRSAA